MKIGIGSDGMGFEYKSKLIKTIESKGYEVFDVGTHSAEKADYCDFAFEVARGVTSGSYDRGILICGTGQGMAMAANKIPGIRAAVCYNVFGAVMSREHNDANILCTGAWMVDYDEFEKAALIWLKCIYEVGRHQIRLDKMAEVEKSR